MARVFIEARPKGRPEGAAIADYVVENDVNRVLHIAVTEAAAIAWAKAQGHTPHVAHVHRLNDKRIPDHWRAV